ncbi:solute carrier family 22 member 21 [Asbolus verrucosus]|uniref:Solute carrier family 22 member 21 n=1 Tax=Asbolus verrucosus TaxID=1661398 RepID=A0A482VBM3_ASBVE|nr:solute carrier family 22 member 21 [Asbolus verrucosus]
MEKLDLDKILISIGEWGHFQTLTYFALCCVVIFSVFPMSYIFVARDIKYRCLYYQPQTNNTCMHFDKNITRTCRNFVFERNQTTIVQDFDVTCDENLWKLTTVGTVSALGELFCLPLAGFLSDRFGRRSMIIVSVLSSTIIGLVRSFSISYLMYITLEFLDTALSSGMYSGAFILAVEIVDSKKRNLGNTIICCAFALGQILLGVAAWMTPSWRIMLRVLYTFGFLVAFAVWLIPESIRWLISKKQYEKAWKVLQLALKFNGDGLKEEIFNQFPKINLREEQKEAVSVMAVLKTKTLLLRTLHCSYTWICCNFPYYGLTIQSVALSENIYFNFIFTSLIEIPAYILTQTIMNRFGRRKTMACSLILGGIACFCVNMVEKDWLILTVFLCGKFFITMAYTTLYIYTAEMFPTKSRHSILAICSMCGRVGSLMAPQVPLLRFGSRKRSILSFQMILMKL